MSKMLTDHNRATVMTMVFLSILLIGLSACTNHTTSHTNTNIPHLRFAVITAGPATDPLWSQVKQGIDRAATTMGVTATYHAPDTFDVSAMSHLIDVAVATKPDGLVLSIPDCAKLTQAIKRTQLVGIPVISILSGKDCASTLRLLNSIGQTDYQMGLESGQKLTDAGAKHVLCINQDVNNPDLVNRCRGIDDAFTQAGGKSEVLALDSNSPTVVQQIQAKLTHNTSIDAIMTLDSNTASLALSAIQDSDYPISAKLATFDLSPEVLQAIQDGTMLFAIDQKPYAQGYQSIVLLSRYKKHQSPITTSTTDPDFVTSNNVLQAEQNPSTL